LGTIGSTFLFGVALSQLSRFFVSDYKTTLALKLLVGLVG
jgi:hypothetical protein